MLTARPLPADGEVGWRATDWQTNARATRKRHASCTLSTHEVLREGFWFSHRDPRNRFQYGGADERAVAVHPAGVVEVLRYLCDAGKLVDEAGGGKR
jgi:hypothetical protein